MTDLPNIILIVLDTARKDILPPYGGNAETPHLSRLAKDGVVYRDCVAPSPWTVPSHASLFTGKYPSQHGVHETRDIKLPRTFDLMTKNKDETIVDYLKERGYNTVGYSANPSVAPGSGFDDSFNAFTLVDATRTTEKEKKTIEWASKYGRTRQEVRSQLLARGRLRDLWKLYRTSRDIEQRERDYGYPRVKGGDALAQILTETSFEEPVFLFVNLFEMHEPYTEGEPIPMAELFGKKTLSGDMLEQVRSGYTRAASVVDSCLGSILGYLRRRELYDSSLVILTSDHGQELKEQGYFGHGTYLHRTIVEVPLIVKFPGERKPPSVEGYQTLVRVPELIKDSLVGVNDGRSVSVERVFSESFGVSHGLDGVEDIEDFPSKRDVFDRPRRSIYQEGFRLVLDGKAGTIEEFDFKGVNANPLDHKTQIQKLIQSLQSLDRQDSAFAYPAAL